MAAVATMEVERQQATEQPISDDPALLSVLDRLARAHVATRHLTTQMASDQTSRALAPWLREIDEATSELVRHPRYRR